MAKTTKTEWLGFAVVIGVLGELMGLLIKFVS